MTAALAAQDVALPQLPPIELGVPAFLQERPTSILWSVSIPAQPMQPPVIAGQSVFVTTLPGVVTAHDLADGKKVLWRQDLSPEHPVSADADRLYVAAGEAVHAHRARDGGLVWRMPTGTLTAPPLVKDGWVIIAPARHTTALRAADGTTVWSIDNGTQRARAAIAGDTLLVPLTNGHVQALDLRTGRQKWSRRLGGVPGEPFVVGDRVYVGASDKHFYCLSLRSGEIEWMARVGADIRGRAASDGKRVFFIALDNVVRALDRVDGGQSWMHPVPFRAFAGPVVAGPSLLIAGPAAEIRLVDVRAGTDLGKISFPDPLATAPAIGELDGNTVVAGVTGGLAESWKLVLASPAGASSLSVPALR